VKAVSFSFHVDSDEVSDVISDLRTSLIQIGFKQNIDDAKYESDFADPENSQAKWKHFPLLVYKHNSRLQIELRLHRFEHLIEMTFVEYEVTEFSPSAEDMLAETKLILREHVGEYDIEYLT